MISKYDPDPINLMIDEGRKLFESTAAIRCPYFNADIALTSDGFNHLLYKSNREARNVRDQVARLKLLKKAFQILRVSGTVQEYRCHFLKGKKIEYWAFHDIVLGTEHSYPVRVIVRRKGEGKYHFWSVMSLGKKKLFRGNIEDT